ncbi:MAG: DNA topoisomerase IV subunit A [Mariprofundaceae bacterium]|nr:DNA topoisomerase IV subunit A [Mariprofundaceae bacterium]
MSHLPIEDVFKQYFRDYGLEVITNRAVPDARDGLQPVHRRILYAMDKLRLHPQGAHKKSARVVGDVIGQYHPHGDMSVYEAMVRMAQPWNLRYPLADGQGNWGSVDGDSAAAMRYTEVRLTALGKALLSEELKEGVVNWQENYDASTSEPVTLPAPVPMLLANGAMGIAVGIATDIPPHNLDELLEACIKLTQSYARNGRETVSEERRFELLRKHIMGPDFPTGGILICSVADMDHLYQTGKGHLLLRADWECESLSRGLWQIVVTSLPYGIKKDALLQKIGEKISNKELSMLDDVMDDSDGDDIRVILQPHSKNLNAQEIMLHLFASTDLQISVRVNMHALINEGQQPQRMSLVQSIDSFLTYRDETVSRRSQVRLDEVNHRLHLLMGLMIAHLNIDTVISIIRNEDEPEAVLKIRFDLSDLQVKAILNLRLRQLHKLEEMEIRTEQKHLEQEKKTLESLLDSSAGRWRLIGRELKKAKDLFGDPRRTTLVTEACKARLMRREAMIDKELLSIVISEAGWLKALRGGNINPEGVRLKEGDKLQSLVCGYSTQYLILIGAEGRAFSMLAADAPRGRGVGEPVSKWFDFSANNMPKHLVFVQPCENYLITTRKGFMFICRGEDMLSRTRKGKNLIKFSDKATLLSIEMIEEQQDAVVIIRADSQMMVVPRALIPTMARGRGLAFLKMGEKGKSQVLRNSQAVSLKKGFKVGNENRKTMFKFADIEAYMYDKEDKKKEGIPLPRSCSQGVVYG